MTTTAQTKPAAPKAKRTAPPAAPNFDAEREAVASDLEAASDQGDKGLRAVNE